MSSHHQAKAALTTTSKDGDATFQIPSKNRKIIPIVMPRAEILNSEKQSTAPSSSKSANPAPSENATTQVATGPSSVIPLKTLSTSPVKVGTIDRASQDSIEPSAPAPSPNRGHPAVNLSNLDVFSANYVPRWLRAVNESFADLQPCTPFPTVDFDAYLTTFAGPEFVQSVPLVAVPPLVPSSIIPQDMTSQNYAMYWLKELQNEFTLQHIQHNSYALYDCELNLVPHRPEFASLKIPGLRENAPRIDLGDTIHIRMLQKGVANKAQVNHWLRYEKNSGVVCPGFTGILRDPQVWEINRAKDEVILCIDGFAPYMKYNVIFLIQQSKVEPLCRAVQRAIRGGHWVKRMLFPDNVNGTLQTSLSKASFDMSWFDDLNWEQKKAVYSILSANYGNVPYLISGPPGTGKTKTLVETALQLIRKPGRLLICAPSDAAADTLALRLSVHLQPSELFRLNSWTRTFAEVPDRLLLYTYASELSFTLPPIELMLSYRIVVTTCRDADLLNRARLTNVALSGLLNGVNRLLNPGSPKNPLHWTALLLDEAAQATEPEVLVALTVVMPPRDVEHEFPQFVAAGDQYQLGPKLLTQSSLSISLFQRLFDRKMYSDHPLSRKKGTKAITSDMLPMIRPAFTNLIRNYRSHPAILSVPSSLFYNDTLITERRTSEAVLSWPDWSSLERWPVMFQQNSSEDFYDSVLEGDGTGAGALYNPGEAVYALNLALSLLQHYDDNGAQVLVPKEIMIMTPFRAQVAYLRKLFRRHHLFEVNIGPLEAFQGLESRIVIICTTRTRTGNRSQHLNHHVMTDKSRGLGIVDEPQRLNVAMTRAEEGLIVIGNAACLTSTRDPAWLNFLDFCRRNNCFKAPPTFEWPDLGGPYSQGRLERALIYHAKGKADAERKAQSDHQSRDSNKATKGLKLKGPRRDMDEEMWQFKELAQLHDSENVDLVLEQSIVDDEGEDDGDHVDVVDEGDNHHVDNQGSGEITNNAGSDQLIPADGYDRDLKQEFYEECSTQ